MRRLSVGLGWVADHLGDAYLLAMVGVWLAASVVLFIAAPWWSGVVCLAIGIPFVGAVLEDAFDGSPY